MTNLLDAKFQRDINRIKQDNERGERKMGLTKLLKDLPWDDKTQKPELINFILEHLFPALLSRINDELEKCRELSLQLLVKSLKVCKSFTLPQLHDLCVGLCARVDEGQYKEPAEELRLSVLELLLKLKSHKSITKLRESNEDLTPISNIDEKIAHTLVKALCDSFPAAKRAGAELLIEVCGSSPAVIRSYFRKLLPALRTNAGHTISKTRTVTFQALGRCLICLSVSEYRALVKDPILSIFSAAVNDRTGVVKIELASIVSTIIQGRVASCLKEQTESDVASHLVPEDLELLALVILLQGDVMDEVSDAARGHLANALRSWTQDLKVLEESENEIEIQINAAAAGEAMVEDGELALQQASAAMTSTAAVDSSVAVELTAEQKQANVRNFLSANLRDLLAILRTGIEGWTSDARRRYLRGLNALLSYVDVRVNAHLPLVVDCIALHIRDDEAEVRSAAEECATTLGRCVTADADQYLVEILLPRVSGEVAGGDTAQQRAYAVNVVNHVLRGLSSRLQQADGTPVSEEAGLSIGRISDALAAVLTENLTLYAYRTVSLRESLLLLLRTLIDTFPVALASHSRFLQGVLLALIFLTAKCPDENDVVHEVAHQQLQRLALQVCKRKSVADVLGSFNQNYEFLFFNIVTFQLEPASSSSTIPGGELTIDALAARLKETRTPKD